MLLNIVLIVNALWAHDFVDCFSCRKRRAVSLTYLQETMIYELTQTEMTQEKNGGRKYYLRYKNRIVYVAIGIVIVSAAYLFLLRTPGVNNPEQSNPQSLQSTSQLIANSRAAAIEQYQNQFCGLNSIPHSNGYIREYRLPAPCEMPLGILVDGQAGKVWYVSTKHGSL